MLLFFNDKAALKLLCVLINDSTSAWKLFEYGTKLAGSENASFVGKLLSVKLGLIGSVENPGRLLLARKAVGGTKKPKLSPDD